MSDEVLFLRVSRDLKEQLREAAKAEDRTLNAEAVRRLLKSFQGYRKL